MDGAVNESGAGSGIKLISLEGPRLQSAIHVGWKATNNNVRYEALIAGLKLTLEMRVKNLNIFSNFMLIVWKIKGSFQTRGPHTELYMRDTQNLMKMFKKLNLSHVPRAQNSHMYALAKLFSERKLSCWG